MSLDRSDRDPGRRRRRDALETPSGARRQAPSPRKVPAPSAGAAAAPRVLLTPLLPTPGGVLGAGASRRLLHPGGGQTAGVLTAAALTAKRPALVLVQPTPDAVPKLDGVGALRRILEGHPSVGVILLTMHEDDEAVFTALRAGARGYLLKDAERDHIVQAVLAVAAGDSVYGRAVVQRIVDFFTGTRTRYTAQVFPGLTARERDVLELVALGLGNHEIARRLVLSEKTIRNNFASVMTKLQVHDRAAAVAKARDAGIGQPH